jgi:ABC-type polysaccharide/polyol phosphate transport system ATPase subunit
MSSSIELASVHLRYPVITSGKQQSILGHIARNATFGLIRKNNAGLKVVHALRGITLKLGPKARLGVVGRNGSGKSTLLKTMAGVLHPSDGQMRVRGRVNSILTLGAGLDPEKTGRENVFMMLSLFGFERARISEVSREIEEFVELDDFFDMPVRTYSSGMSVRLSFGLVTAIDGDILIIDEVLGAGDAYFMHRASERIEKLAENASIMVFASHSRSDLKRFCKDAIWMHAGKIVASGSVDDIFDAYEAIGDGAPPELDKINISF